MNTVLVLQLMQKYGTCLQCGSDKVGNGAGTLVIEDHTFERTCVCGWGIKENHQPTERG